MSIFQYSIIDDITNCQNFGIAKNKAKIQIKARYEHYQWVEDGDEKRQTIDPNHGDEKST